MLMFLNIFVIPNKYFKLQTQLVKVLFCNNRSRVRNFLVTKKCIQIFCKTKKIQVFKIARVQFLLEFIFHFHYNKYAGLEL